MRKASVKVEGGKMVNVQTDPVSVTGDFFIEPPEAREEIEEILEELGGKDPEKIVGKLKDIEADFIGFSAEDVVEAFVEARKDE
jgi:lipoate-protein ligase A